MLIALQNIHGLMSQVFSRRNLRSIESDENRQTFRILLPIINWRFSFFFCNSLKSNFNNALCLPDADVEDNIESDVSRHRFQMPDVGGEEGVGVSEQGEVGKLAGGSHLDTTQTGPGASIQQDADRTSETKDTLTEITDTMSQLSIKTEHTQDDETCHSVTPSNVSEHTSKDDSKDIDSESPRTCISSTSTIKPKKSRSERKVIAQMRAMNSLAPRYQPVPHECSVVSCLNQFTAAELLTGNNKFGCQTCSTQNQPGPPEDAQKEMVYTNASKQVLIFSPPAVLTLHLKRFQQVWKKIANIFEMEWNNYQLNIKVFPRDIVINHYVRM